MDIASLLKIRGSEITALHELMMLAAGPYALPSSKTPWKPAARHLPATTARRQHLLQYAQTTIYGGSNEVQSATSCRKSFNSNKRQNTMDFDFTDDQEQLRDAVRKCVDKATTLTAAAVSLKAGGFSRNVR
jgi:hypothetical protein